MKVNRPVNEACCYNCRKYEECRAKGIFDDHPDLCFCINYEDETYFDDDDNEKVKP